MSPLASNRGLRLVHPLAGITRPSLHDLVARADAEAALVLLRAGRLAAWRQRVGARAVALHEALFAPPWSGPTPSWSLPFPVVTPADLARALLADHADLVGGSVLAIEPAHPKAFTTAAARWRHALDEVEESESTSATAPLVRSWARRLALGALDHPDRRWTLAHLVCESLLPTWVDLTDRFVEGLLTRAESEARLVDALGIARSRGLLPTEALDPLVPAPYLDHFDGVRALETQLERGPGALLVGARGSGRRALLATCQWRHRRREGPPALRGHGFHLDRTYDLPRFDAAGALVLPPELGDHQVFALVHHGIHAAVDPSDAHHRPWLATLREALDRTRRPERSTRLVLGVTPEQHDALRSLLPELELLPTIRIPPRGPAEHVAVWLCRLVAREDPAEAPIELASILGGLHARAPIDRELTDRHADLLAPAPALRRAMARWRRRSDEPTPPLRRVLDELELSVDDLRVLAALEAAMNG